MQGRIVIVFTRAKHCLCIVLFNCHSNLRGWCFRSRINKVKLREAMIFPRSQFVAEWSLLARTFAEDKRL